MGIFLLSKNRAWSRNWAFREFGLKWALDLLRLVVGIFGMIFQHTCITVPLTAGRRQTAVFKDLFDLGPTHHCIPPSGSLRSIISRQSTYTLERMIHWIWRTNFEKPLRNYFGSLVAHSIKVTPTNSFFLFFLCISPVDGKLFT